MPAVESNTLLSRWTQMNRHTCRSCGSGAGHLVLDLGGQPASDYFPSLDVPGPDPVYPLQMWLCSRCDLAQLVADPTVPEEPKGVEPAALVAQAKEAVHCVGAAGLLPAGARVAEYGSPHGGSWLELLAERNVTPAPGTTATDIVLDCFGLMHASAQAAALAERVARIVPGGLLLLQYHSLATIIEDGQWNALRHGHYAYYSMTALSAMLGAVGFSPRSAWEFDLYGGTVLLAARRDRDDRSAPDPTVRAILAAEVRSGVCDPQVVSKLGRVALDHAHALHDWLTVQRAAGRTVLGYGAASRAVALLRMADVNREILAGVADASPAKQGLRMPGTAIPVISPTELTERRPDVVLLFVPDLMAEVRAAYPDVETAGGRWVSVDALVSTGRR